jgi:hypothetical protein
VYQFDTTRPEIPGQKIIGELSFGSGIDSTRNPLMSFLNHPTGLAIGENNLFIADTNNDRILRYDLTEKKIYELLTNKDGIQEPNGLLYDTAR